VRVTARERERERECVKVRTNECGIEKEHPTLPHKPVEGCRGHYSQSLEAPMLLFAEFIYLLIYLYEVSTQLRSKIQILT
jgi:hypothetical protein